MDAMLATFFAVLVAEMGDRSQVLAAALAIRFHDDRRILAGLTLATLLNCAISAAAGSVIDQWISEEPVRLFIALAYIFAGAGMLMWRRRVDILSGWKTGAFTTSFLGLFILQFGDKSQFLIAAQSAGTPFWGFAFAGGALGVLAACVPAILLREKMAQMLPIGLIRKMGGLLLLLWGAYLALGVFDLI
ncbi:TMEM165/GDT1 family protein [Sphingorhabdus arenilitoris]|uniref:GDT1 family protein n=1 Tax=Sphingorhabdus arenilitoris TaxID=1490041 RepID=A0ABV8RIW5_9SPHN